MIAAEAGDFMTMAAEASFHIGSTKYPDPPPAFFHLNPDSETMLYRYNRFLDRGEPLPSFAYAYLTFLEGTAGSRAKAATMYGISGHVLDNLGDLSSSRGGRMDARKLKTPLPPLSGAEGAWLEAVVKKIVERLCDTRTGSDLPEITMADLPKL